MTIHYSPLEEGGGTTKTKIFLLELTEWFCTIKAPYLKEKAVVGMEKIYSGQPLEKNSKKLFGFMLFSYAMNHGPHTFRQVEMTAKELDIVHEFEEYAQNWLAYSHNLKTNNNEQ